ncbi:MAG: Gfo/Idh/MocA family oxidoreductase [Armatimonadetes bacterium]|nr:Gfo/Idh/MocA family oxidoreductase [Armatimonadota bacterium]
MGVRLGIVGCGAFGSQFISLFAHHPLVSRLALCDRDSTKLATRAREHQVTETYDSLDALCASEVEAVALFTQPWLHAAQAVQVMNAGKHVYSAVPAAQSLEECDQVVEASRRTGQYFMTGETSYFRRECAWCREKAQQGAFGKIVLVEAEYLHDLDHGLREVAQWRHGADWGPDKTGGVPMHYPTHSMSYVVAITGAHAVSVSCLGFTLPGDDWFRTDTVSGNVQSNQTALFELSNGAAGRILEYRRVGHRGAERVTRVYGTEGCWESGVAGSHWCTKSSDEPVDPPADFEPLPPALAADRGGHGGSHAFLVNEFVMAVHDRRQPRLNAWEAVRYCAPGLVAHQSALRGGERLPVPDWGDAPP